MSMQAKPQAACSPAKRMVLVFDITLPAFVFPPNANKKFGKYLIVFCFVLWNINDTNVMPDGLLWDFRGQGLYYAQGRDSGIGFVPHGDRGKRNKEGVALMYHQGVSFADYFPRALVHDAHHERGGIAWKVIGGHVVAVEIG